MLLQSLLKIDSTVNFLLQIAQTTSTTTFSELQLSGLTSHLDQEWALAFPSSWFEILGISGRSRTFASPSPSPSPRRSTSWGPTGTSHGVPCFSHPSCHFVGGESPLAWWGFFLPPPTSTSVPSPPSHPNTPPLSGRVQVYPLFHPLTISWLAVGHQSLKCGAGICLGACLAGCSRHCRTEQTGTWQVIVSKVKVASYHLGAYDQISYFCKGDQFLLTKE